MRLADDDGAESELTYEAAAVPAGSECGDHEEIAVRGLTACAAEGVGLAVNGWVVLLDAAVVSRADEFATAVEYGCADWDAAFCEAGAGFGERNLKHCSVVQGWLG